MTVIIGTVEFITHKVNCVIKFNDDNTYYITQNSIDSNAQWN